MQILRRLKRKLLLAMLERQTPEKLQALGRKRLPGVFARAARHSVAYGALLHEAGVAAGQVRTGEDVLAQAPILTKADLFERFPVQQRKKEDYRKKTG